MRMVWIDWMPVKALKEALSMSKGYSATALASQICRAFHGLLYKHLVAWTC